MADGVAHPAEEAQVNTIVTLNRDAIAANLLPGVLVLDDQPDRAVRADNGSAGLVGLEIDQHPVLEGRIFVEGPLNLGQRGGMVLLLPGNVRGKPALHADLVFGHCLLLCSVRRLLLAVLNGQAKILHAKVGLLPAMPTVLFFSRVRLVAALLLVCQAGALEVPVNEAAKTAHETP